MENRSPGDFGNIRIRVTVGAVLVALSIAFIALYNWLPARRDVITFAAAVIGGSATVYSAYFASAALRLSAHLTRDGNTFDLLKELNAMNLTRIRMKIKKKLPAKELAKDQMGELITSDQELLEDVNMFLSLFEDTSIAVQYDHVNEQILYASLSFLVPNAYKTLRPYIEYRRDMDGDQTIFREVQKLAQAWMEKKSLRSGEPLA